MTDPFLPTAAAAPAAPRAGAAMDRRVTGSRGYRLRLRLRRWRLPLGLLGLGAAGWLGLRLVPAAGTLSVNAADLETGVAAWAPFQDYLPVRATVAPLRSVFLAALSGGQVARVAVLDGARVRAGEILATLSNPQLQLDVSGRAAAVAGLLGNATAAQLALQQSLATERSAIGETSYQALKARRDLSVREELHGQGFESDASVRNFADEAAYYARRLAMLRGAYAHDMALAEQQSRQIDQTRKLLADNLASVQSGLAALVIRAPVSGRLTDFQLQPGQTVRPGDQLGQIDSDGAFRLDADIDEFYLDRVNQGEAATADFGAAPVRLVVSRVRPQVSNGQFRTELTFVGAPPAGLRRGETADLRITLGATRTTLVVPNGPWLNATGGTSIFVLDRSGRHAARRGITIGRRNPGQVEVSSGLAAGARVITSSTAGFQDYARLSIR